MSVLSGQNDSDWTPLDWCCGGSFAADNASYNESLLVSESESCAYSGGDATRETFGIPAKHRYPPIVFSPADRSELTLSSRRSFARSITELTFAEDEQLFAVVADIIGNRAANLGDKIVLSMGYNGGRSVGHNNLVSGADQSSRLASKKNNVDDNTATSSNGPAIPSWVGIPTTEVHVPVGESKPEKNQNKTEKKRGRFDRFRFFRNKKTAVVQVSQSDNSTSTATSSLCEIEFLR